MTDSFERKKLKKKISFNFDNLKDIDGAGLEKSQKSMSEDVQTTPSENQTAAGKRKIFRKTRNRTASESETSAFVSKTKFEALDRMLSDKMLAPSPAFQKALISINDKQKERRMSNSSLNYDDIDWNTLPDNINYTQLHVSDILGSRCGKRKSIDDSVVGVRVAPSRRRCAITETGLQDLDPEQLVAQLKKINV